MVINNIIYIANLIALKHWYGQVRRLFISELFPQPLLDALQDKIGLALAERIERLEAVCLKFPDTAGQSEPSKSAKMEAELVKRWPDLKATFLTQQTHGGAAELRDPFLKKVDQGIANFGSNYLAVIQGLDPSDSGRGTRWLQGIIDDIILASKAIMPILC